MKHWRGNSGLNLHQTQPASETFLNMYLLILWLSFFWRSLYQAFSSSSVMKLGVGSLRKAAGHDDEDLAPAESTEYVLRSWDWGIWNNESSSSQERKIILPAGEFKKVDIQKLYIVRGRQLDTALHKIVKMSTNLPCGNNTSPSYYFKDLAD